MADEDPGGVRSAPREDELSGDAGFSRYKTALENGLVGGVAEGGERALAAVGLTGLAELAAEVNDLVREEDPACLLYTSRCV